MAARAMWKAEIAIGEMRVPVKLFAAVKDTTIRFRLLHKTDKQPVVQQMVDPKSGAPVPADQIRRGIEVDPGIYVLLSGEDQARLEPEDSREIRVEQVVKREQIDERWFDRPYFLGPDGENEGYFALAEALAYGERIGVARWVMRKQQYTGALHASHGYLMLDTMRHADEIVRLGKVKPSAQRAPDSRERDLAAQLIEALEEEFDPSDYEDEHRKAVQQLVDSKAAGKIVQFPKDRHAKTNDSLVDSLAASIKGLKRANNGS